MFVGKYVSRGNKHCVEGVGNMGSESKDMEREKRRESIIRQIQRRWGRGNWAMGDSGMTWRPTLGYGTMTIPYTRSMPPDINKEPEIWRLHFQ